jgi:UDP-N-acetylglucosamine transferase subunit ALG13
MIFVTVGSMLPFNRLIETMDQWIKLHPDEKAFAQIGAGSYQPGQMEWRRIIEPTKYKSVVQSCSLIVAHAGTGSVFTASEFCKPIVLFPRRAAQKEHTTDHQVDTAKWLENKVGIFVAWTESDLGIQIDRAREATEGDRFQIPRYAPEQFLSLIKAALQG